MPNTLSDSAPARSVISAVQHLLGISLEDYFHVGAFRDLISRNRWRRFEPRLEQATAATLDLLDAAGVKATFFTLGWVAEHMPELLRTVAERGHEVANSGFSHRGVKELGPDELRDELLRGHEAIALATGYEPRGTRIPDWLRESELWALDVVAGLGYAYDASFRPLGMDCHSAPARRFPFTHIAGDRSLEVFPVPTARVGGVLVPIGGGNWFRQLPEGMLIRAVDQWQRESGVPFSMYAQSWELDPAQPRITAASWLTSVRHYRNLGRTERLLRRFLSQRQFVGYARFLELPLVPHGGSAAVPAGERMSGMLTGAAPSATGAGGQVPVTIVVPCYNEADTLPYLLKTLEGVSSELQDRYRLSYVFVDDGSADATWSVMQSLLGDRVDVQIVRHASNQGIAHAILTGIAAARDEFVCSIDADCTYDPRQLAALLPPLEAGADLVTASPYHPEGHVRHVPAWRLMLSRGLSQMYSWRLRSDLHTYTSCFRAYRRSRFVGLSLAHSGFLGIAETLVRSVLGGAAVVEVPATLEVRLLGHSKLRVFPVIMGHLRLFHEMRRWGSSTARAAMQLAESAQREALS